MVREISGWDLYNANECGDEDDLTTRWEDLGFEEEDFSDNYEEFVPK